MNARTLAPLAIKAVLGAALALGCAVAPHAHADDVNAYQFDDTQYVKLSELPAIDAMPVCHIEDGSDVDPALLPCVWSNQGNSWLTFEDHSFLIVDDTVQ